MPRSRAPVPSLADLRTEIDRIDETMHELLMQRGEIIDRLIAVKRTEETGSAFRPAREAEPLAVCVWSTVHGFVSLELSGALQLGDAADAAWERTLDFVAAGIRQP